MQNINLNELSRAIENNHQVRETSIATDVKTDDTLLVYLKGTHVDKGFILINISDDDPNTALYSAYTIDQYPWDETGTRIPAAKADALTYSDYNFSNDLDYTKGAREIIEDATNAFPIE